METLPRSVGKPPDYADFVFRVVVDYPSIPEFKGGD
jgi:hypothetical protein